MQNAVQRNQGANPQELASAMRKMEECLQVFAQLSGAPSPSPQKMLQGAQQPVQQATQQAAPQQPQQRVLSPTNNRLVFSIIKWWKEIASTHKFRPPNANFRLYVYL